MFSVFYRPGLVVVSLFVALFTSSAVFAGSYDGTWKVRRTGVNCTPTGLITVRIKKNAFSGSYIGGSGKHIVSGAISASGNFKFEAKSPRDRVVFQGQISADKGEGRWSVRGRSCGGSLKIFR